MDIIPIVVMPKNVRRSGNFITFRKINASGIERVTVAVMNANAVPRDIPFSMRTPTIGMTLSEFA